MVYAVSEFDDTIEKEKMIIEKIKGAVCSDNKIYFKEDAISYGTS